MKDLLMKGKMMLTDEQRIALLPKVMQKGKEPVTQVWLTQGDAISYSERIEAAATEPLRQRIAELEEMNAQLREQNTEVDKACAELERRIKAGKNIVRNDMHRIGQLQARVTELERKLEESRKDAERYRWLFLPHTEESLSIAEQTQTMPKPSKQDAVIAHISAWYTPKSKADSIIDTAMQNDKPVGVVFQKGQS